MLVINEFKTKPLIKANITMQEGTRKCTKIVSKIKSVDEEEYEKLNTFG